MKTITATESNQIKVAINPKDWKVVSLIDACSKIGSGITPRGAEKVYKESGIVLIRSQNVYNNSFNKDGLVYIDEATAREMENVTLEEEDVLLNITGDSVARCCTVPKEILPARVNQHVCIIRTNRGELNPIFLRYYLTSPRMQAFMLSLARSGGTRNALTKGVIEKFLIPLPTLKEQAAIAKVLLDLDSRIELSRRMNKTLEAIGGSIFKHWFIDFEFPNEEGKPFSSSGGETVYSEELGRELPQGWEVKRFSQAIDVNPRRELQRGKVAKKVGMADLNPWQSWIESWTLDKYESGQKFKNRDILLARITPSLEHGKTAMVSILDDDEFGFGSTEFIVLCKKVLSSESYIFYLSISEEIRAAAINSMTGTSGRQRVPESLFDSMSIAVPPSALVEKFEKIVSLQFDTIAANARQIRTLSEIRDLLLPKLMSGKIRVPKEVR